MVYLKSLDFTTQESPSSTRWGGSKFKIPIEFTEIERDQGSSPSEDLKHINETL